MVGAQLLVRIRIVVTLIIWILTRASLSYITRLPIKQPRPRWFLEFSPMSTLILNSPELIASRLTTGGTYRQTLHASSVLSSMSDSFVRLAAANVMWLLWYHCAIGQWASCTTERRGVGIFLFLGAIAISFSSKLPLCNIMFHLKGKSDFCRRLDYKHQK